MLSLKRIRGRMKKKKKKKKMMITKKKSSWSETWLPLLSPMPKTYTRAWRGISSRLTQACVRVSVAQSHVRPTTFYSVNMGMFSSRPNDIFMITCYVPTAWVAISG
jgi:hypothetical protein